MFCEDLLTDRFDREHLWHPYTETLHPLPTYKVKSASGCRITLADGTELIEGMSSWWCALHGYNHPVLNRAVQTQLKSMAHVMFGGLTHEPAATLGKLLLSIAPPSMSKIFYADSGSVAVEVALKMAVQYQAALGHGRRTNFVTIRSGYHGDTWNAMSVCDPVTGMHTLFGPALPVRHFVPAPQSRFGSDWDPHDIDALRQTVEKHADELAALILEPIVQGAGGMRMYDISFLKRARELCNQYDVLLIFDEVATGFGRTGNRFVADLVLPDILVLGKALTGGYIGHAVTVANHKVFDAFYSDDDRLALMHGPTFMGNPLACAVALKGIEIFERDDYMSKIRHIEQISRQEMENFSDPRIKEVRIMGGCTCVEVHDSKTLEGFQQFAYERGVFCRPFLNYMYSMVPYVISDGELIQIFDVMKDWFH